jgi:hypothetical protein
MALISHLSFNHFWPKDNKMDQKKLRPSNAQVPVALQGDTGSTVHDFQNITYYNFSENRWG